MLATLGKCLAFLPVPARWRWASLIPLAVTGALLEAVGVVAVFTLIKIINDPSQVTSVPVISHIYTMFPWHEERQIVFSFTILVGLFYIVKNCLLAFATYRQNTVASDSVAALARRMLRGYLTAPYASLFQRNSAELIRNITDSIDAVFQQVLLSAVGLVSEVLIITGIVITLMLTAPFVTLITTVILFGAVVSLLKLTRQAFARWGTRQQELKRAILQNLQQSLGGLKEVKVMGREEFFCDLFASRQDALMHIRARSATLNIIPRLLIETIFVCGMLLVILLVTGYGTTGVDLVPLLGLYAYAGFRITPSVYHILLHLGHIRLGTAATNQVYADFISLEHTRSVPFGEADGERLTFADRLVLDQVSYTYGDPHPPVLQDVTLIVRRGESVAIVGPTGVGKSTLIDLILGLLQPSSGRITVDGKEVSQALRSWQRKIGYVPQSIFLTDDSMRRNIAFGLKDADIDEQKLHTAIRMAQLEELVASLPRGLDTVVGERGARLSGGQRQRVGIARALYHEPEVLIFDEATSALDNQTERAVIGAIEALRGEKTLVIVAHRLSTVRGCDRLVFLRDGRIAGWGSFEELLTNNADFRAMAAAAVGNGISRDR
ncbi:MAG TPA: ABC transporter ATP-binding protein [Candidatus Binatia bacterium]|jgi:ATP-binding cassette subfamily C protein|nr:ABC transporter ATP-binding protein [Candidatus Binatia bacterium]